MPTKNDKSKTERPTPTSQVLAGYTAAQLDEWNNANPVERNVNGKKAMVVPPLQLSATVPSDLFREVTLYSGGQTEASIADGFSGGTVDGEVKTGYLSRAVRIGLFRMFLPAVDAVKYEQDRDARLTAERAERMSGIAAARGESLETVRTKLTVLEKLMANPSLRKMIEADDPELFGLLTQFDTDS